MNSMLLHHIKRVSGVAVLMSGLFSSQHLCGGLVGFPQVDPLNEFLREIPTNEIVWIAGNPVYTIAWMSDRTLRISKVATNAVYAPPQESLKHVIDFYAYGNITAVLDRRGYFYVFGHPCYKLEQETYFRNVNHPVGCKIQYFYPYIYVLTTNYYIVYYDVRNPWAKDNFLIGSVADFGVDRDGALWIITYPDHRLKVIRNIYDTGWLPEGKIKCMNIDVNQVTIRDEFDQVYHYSRSPSTNVYSTHKITLTEDPLEMRTTLYHMIEQRKNGTWYEHLNRSYYPNIEPGNFIFIRSTNKPVPAIYSHYTWHYDPWPALQIHHDVDHVYFWIRLPFNGPQWLQSAPNPSGPWTNVTKLYRRYPVMYYEMKKQPDRQFFRLVPAPL